MTGCAKKRLIVTADDLGISLHTNEAISLACDKGILTSASLLASGPAFEDALANVVVQHRQLGIGVHLSLTGLMATLEPKQVFLLADECGRFKRTFLGVWRLMRSPRRAELADQIDAEFQAQLEKVLARGVAIDHINSHQHVHMIPGVFEILVALAQRYGNLPVRLTYEPIRWTAASWRTRLAKLDIVGRSRQALLNRFARRNGCVADRVPHPDAVYGILHSGRVGKGVFRDMIRSIDYGVSEVITHPALPYKTGQRQPLGRSDRKFLRSPNRQVELETLMDAEMANAVRDGNIRLTTFKHAFSVAGADAVAALP